MEFRKLFLYEGESVRSKAALVRNVYLLLGFFTFLFTMVETSLYFATISIIPAVYWVPMFQGLLEVGDTRNNYLVFLLLVSPVFSVLAVPLGFWYSLGASWILAIVSIVSQTLLVVYLAYKFEETRYRKHYSFLKSRFEGLKASYFNLKSLKVLLGVGASLVILFLAFDYGLSFYVNNLSDPVNEDASYPEEAFSSLYSELENDEMFGDEAERVYGKDLREISGSTLQKRLIVSGVGMMDVGVTGGEMFAAVQEKNSEKPSFKGYKELKRCSEGFSGSSAIECVDSKYPAVFSRTYKNWLNLALNLGGLERLYNNKTAMKVFENYLERAKFYDSYLLNGIDQRPIEAVYYSSKSGLYVLGESDSPVYVDGERLNGSTRRSIYHSNTSLDTGYHNVSRDGFSLRMPVYGFKPEYNSRDGEFLIEGSRNRSLFFERAILYGEGWNKTVELGRNHTTLEPEVNVTSIELVNDNMSVKFASNLAREQDERPQSGEAFGMSEKEYKRLQWLLNSFSFVLDDPQEF